ncbi:M57 family metalloprotease [Xanthovirga aplysinae]|uniref:M57 family metalloprotease n=1 Tax=Xanthovirga aplysinae TaxID=2529853 RepID=UPI0012BCE97C|nr:M57 family metalloprotease [Xanthovirga aplysinae]MTI31766.1 hypothetical protein [Xanthovirga aplysinae]
MAAFETAIAHEIGHYVGFRYADYLDKSFSCGGPDDNESDERMGDNYIPGTPTDPKAGS